MAVRILNYGPECDVVPQAIIWRPLRYFTLQIHDGADGLDSYKGASFSIGNDIRFDLRHYRGHPGLTVSLYLDEALVDEKRINEIIDIIVREMLIPLSAIAWRRGQKFKYGKLERSASDRLLEWEARILVLKIASQQPGYAASTSLLKKEVPKYIELSPQDRVKSKSRKNEEIWQQIVGNVLVHYKTKDGPFVQGYAEKIEGGLSVTPKGLSYLNSMGFLPTVDADFAE